MTFTRSAVSTLRRQRLCRISAVLAAILLQIADSPASHAVQADISSAPHPYADHVAAAALRFDIPIDWIWKVMQVESRGRQGAMSRAGAMGLMQIMPGTWAVLTARHGLGNDPYDARANIMAGAAYLRAMWDRYGDVSLMLAAYNAGPGRADAYAAGRRGLPAETIAYVAKLAPAMGRSHSISAARPASAPQPSWREAALFASPPAALGTALAPAPSDTAAPPPTPTQRLTHPLFAVPSGAPR